MTVTNHAAHIALRDRASRLRSPSMLAPVRCLAARAGAALLNCCLSQWRFPCQLRKYVPQYPAPPAKSAAVNRSVPEHAAIRHAGKGWRVFRLGQRTAEWVIAVAKKAAPLQSLARARKSELRTIVRPPWVHPTQHLPATWRRARVFIDLLFGYSHDTNM
jgi:hypothetical protein